MGSRERNRSNPREVTLQRTSRERDGFIAHSGLSAGNEGGELTATSFPGSFPWAVSNQVLVAATGVALHRRANAIRGVLAAAEPLPARVAPRCFSFARKEGMKVIAGPHKTMAFSSTMSLPAFFFWPSASRGGTYEQGGS